MMMKMMKIKMINMMMMIKMVGHVGISCFHTAPFMTVSFEVCVKLITSALQAVHMPFNSTLNDSLMPEEPSVGRSCPIYKDDGVQGGKRRKKGTRQK